MEVPCWHVMKTTARGCTSTFTRMQSICFRSHIKTMWRERLHHWEHPVSGTPAVIPQRELTSFLFLHFPTLIAYRQADEASPVSFNLAEGRGEEHLWDSIFGIIYNNKFSLLYASLGLLSSPLKARVKDICLLPVEVNVSRQILIQKVKNMDILGRSIPAFMLLYESTHAYLFLFQCGFL